MLSQSRRYGILRRAVRDSERGTHGWVAGNLRPEVAGSGSSWLGSRQKRSFWVPGATTPGNFSFAHSKSVLVTKERSKPRPTIQGKLNPDAGCSFLFLLPTKRNSRRHCAWLPTGISALVEQMLTSTLWRLLLESQRHANASRMFSEPFE